MPHLFVRIRELYQSNVAEPGKAQEFWMLLAFLVTFLTTRAVTITVRRSNALVHGIRIRDIHVHHLVWGIALLLLSGYLAAARNMHGIGVAVMFGVGAALTLDEFALWLHLEDVYWSDRGRHSVQIVIVLGSLAGLALVGLDFWTGLARAVYGAIG